MPYVTPMTLPADTRCWRLSIPRDRQLIGAVTGALHELTKSHNWEQVTGVSADAVAAMMQTMYDEFEIGSWCMIGSLIHFVTISPPNGVLLCDGTQYLRVDYPDLYADLPISLIVDADNFIVPTIEDVFMLGAGATYSPEDVGGAETHQLSEAELPSHVHSYGQVTTALDFFSAGPPDPTGVGIPFIPTPTSSIGSDAAHENMPPFVAYKVGIVAR